MAIQVIGHFWSETQIICLWHEGSMIGVQCQLMIYRGTNSAYKMTPHLLFYLKRVLRNEGLNFQSEAKMAITNKATHTHTHTWI